MDFEQAVRNLKRGNKVGRRSYGGPRITPSDYDADDWIVIGDEVLRERVANTPPPKSSTAALETPLSLRE